MARKRQIGSEILKGIREIKQGEIGRITTFPPLATGAAGSVNLLGGKVEPNRQSIVERLATEAIRRGAELLEVEYKAGYEEVFAVNGEVGQGSARLPSSSQEAVSLREELYRIVKKKLRIAVDESQYEVRGSVYDSFGEDAFRLALRRV
jgi:hypothetical protein